MKRLLLVLGAGLALAIPASAGAQTYYQGQCSGAPAGNYCNDDTGVFSTAGIQPSSDHFAELGSGQDYFTEASSPAGAGPDNFTAQGYGNGVASYSFQNCPTTLTFCHISHDTFFNSNGTNNNGNDYVWRNGALAFNTEVEIGGVSATGWEGFLCYDAYGPGADGQDYGVEVCAITASSGGGWDFGSSPTCGNPAAQPYPSGYEIDENIGSDTDLFTSLGTGYQPGAYAGFQNFAISVSGSQLTTAVDRCYPAAGAIDPGQWVLTQIERGFEGGQGSLGATEDMNDEYASSN